MRRVQTNIINPATAETLKMPMTGATDTLCKSLRQEMLSLCEKIDRDRMSSYALFIEAVSTLKRFRDMGISQHVAYDLLTPVYQSYPDGSPQEEFMGDVLDCICGNIGNKEFRVY